MYFTSTMEHPDGSQSYEGMKRAGNNFPTLHTREIHGLLNTYVNLGDTKTAAKDLIAKEIVERLKLQKECANA